jgi:hypothetical protein
LALTVCLAAPTSALALNTEIEIDGSVTSQITGLAFGPAGTYSKPGFPLLLPETGVVGDSLTHNGGSFTFSSGETAASFTYADWVYNFNSGQVGVTDIIGGGLVIAPFRLENLDLVAGTADLVFNMKGATDWNTLTVGVPFSAGDLFGTTTFVPEPSTATLMALGLVGLAARRRSS